jgi:hypothetical protein
VASLCAYLILTMTMQEPVLSRGVDRMTLRRAAEAPVHYTISIPAVPSPQKILPSPRKFSENPLYDTG